MVVDYCNIICYNRDIARQTTLSRGDRDMTNGTDISQDYADECPVHATPEKKSYSFGTCDDAEVVVYSGCKCATCHVLTGFSDAFYYDNYAAASGKAKMAVKMASAW